MIAGDQHNFGQRVSLTADRKVHKPQHIYLERILLSDSHFRSSVNALFLAYGQVSPFSAVPCLEFWGDDLYSEGHVEFLDVDAAIDSLSSNAFASVGSLLALLLWAGIGDLHSENILAGRCRRSGRFVLAPIDVESVFDDLMLPSQQLIIATEDFPTQLSWLGKFMASFRGKLSIQAISALTGSFLGSLDLLLRHHDSLSQELIRGLDLSRCVSRVIPRSTKEYLRVLRGDSFEHKLSPCELEQLDRGDVPYYFRFLGDDVVYFRSRTGIKQASVRDGVDNVKFSSSRCRTGNIRLQSDINALRKGSTMQLARSLASLTAATGDAAFGETTVRRSNDYIYFRRGQERWRTKISH